MKAGSGQDARGGGARSLSQAPQSQNHQQLQNVPVKTYGRAASGWLLGGLEREEEGAGALGRRSHEFKIGVCACAAPAGAMQRHTRRTTPPAAARDQKRPRWQPTSCGWCVGVGLGCSGGWLDQQGFVCRRRQSCLLLSVAGGREGGWMIIAQRQRITWLIVGGFDAAAGAGRGLAPTFVCAWPRKQIRSNR